MTDATRAYAEAVRQRPHGGRSPFGAYLEALIAASDEPPPMACVLDLIDRGAASGIVAQHLDTVDPGRSEQDLWEAMHDRLAGSDPWPRGRVDAA
ncbi:MAG: hypothetical protein F4Z29_00525 [Gemmatimonadetes bacterium]|nr:hypothetical protein [Gemmatimonadota bacterium]